MVGVEYRVRIVPFGLEMVCSRLLLVHGVCLNSPK